MLQFGNDLEWVMRTALMVTTVSATLLFTTQGRAGATHPCIPKATEALPHIAGLAIKQTRMRPASATILSTWKGQSRPIIVDINFVASGADETYSFLCVVTRGAAFVQRTMN
jgi:hypothetical protein